MRFGDATRSGATWPASVVHAALRSLLPASGRGLGGTLRMAAQEFPDLQQAGDFGLERSRCVVMRRLDVGALRQRRVDAMEFGGVRCATARGLRRRAITWSANARSRM
jgi:hypothetical protein